MELFINKRSKENEMPFYAFLSAQGWAEGVMWDSIFLKHLLRINFEAMYDSWEKLEQSRKHQLVNRYHDVPT